MYYFIFFAAGSKVLSFFNKDTRGEVQTVTFDNDEVKKIFYGSFHKVKDWNYEGYFLKRCSLEQSTSKQKLLSVISSSLTVL